MDNQKSRDELEKEIQRLQILLYEEKQKKVETLHGTRMACLVITLAISFLFLCVMLAGTSGGVQWLFLILFFGAGFVVLGLICRTHKREEDDARKWPPSDV